MSQYLSPGVYVEEADTGNKPIEGVSTSTAGVVGVTERGPANVPTLVTSFGDYRRMFGGYLEIDDFTDPGGREHCYLPHAVEGLFVNGGKRLYVTRVTADEATRADRRLFFDDLAAANPIPTVLLRAAEEATGTADNPPLLVTLDAGGLAIGDVIRIGDGSRTEYRTVVNVGATTHISLNLPLQGSHPSGRNVQDIVRTPQPGLGTFTVPQALVAGATEIVLAGVAADILALTGSLNQLFEVGAAPVAEYLFAIAGVALTPTTIRVTLAHPLQRDHATTTIATPLQIPGPGPAPTLVTAANGGDSIIYLTALGGFVDPTRLALVDPGVDQEVRRLGELALFETALPPYEAYPVGSLVELVSTPDDVREVNAVSTKKVIKLDDTSLLEPGMQLQFGLELGTIQSVDTTSVTLLAELLTLPVAPDPVGVQPRTLTAEAAIGAMTLQLDARIGLGLDVANADVLRIGIAPNHEIVTVVRLADPHAAAPDAGAVVLERPLQRTYPVGTPVRRVVVSVDPLRQATSTLLETSDIDGGLLVADASSYVPGETIRVTLPSGDQLFHLIDSVVTVVPGSIEIDLALTRSHTAGASISERQQLFTVRALDTGAWGNRVLVTAAEEEVGLVPRAEVTAATASPGPGIPSTVRLNTVTGVEPGTVLELRTHDGTAQIGGFLKVRAIDRAANNLVILDAPGLSAVQVAAFAAAGANRLLVRSREFRMEVMLLKRPNPAVPIRNEELVERELFRTLSMDPRHSRYFERIIGSTFVDGAATDDLDQPLRRSDRRSEGGSNYVRVHDLGLSDADRERVRLGPEALFDVLPSGLTRAARLRLGDGESAAVYGDDQIPLMGDAMYIGVDDREPAKRTGIHALKNALDISLIAAPGQVTPAVQQALIDQCEQLRYRFAVLDAQGPASDTIDDITAQRQQFDTKYAAFYHPWLTIPDPFPTNLASVAQYPIPPSGHILGIYARTDERRGVHKAPANEVVGGMTGLTRYLNQAEQDVLNAYPVNIDVIRDFRVNNRGIRVWGARVITSDTDWKYVNVRRLLIFIEDSIDRGLQWVVFEPNEEALWARVRRSVSNFLTTVWRNGALEGATKDQAFYVKCDRTTMTQDDIDNGRLICVIGVAPVKPAEFVIIRIGLWTADASS
ncbi:MAG: phage tail sheath C-terminal domain-containing protein [Kofleriaceae bacterium]